MRQLSQIVSVTLIFLTFSCGRDTTVDIDPPPTAGDETQNEAERSNNDNATAENQPDNESGANDSTHSDNGDTDVSSTNPTPTPKPSSTPVPKPTPASTPKPVPTATPTTEPSYFKVLYDKVEFKVYLPSNFSKENPRRLAVFLHGDTANGYFENYFISLKDYALKRGFIFVAALSPNRDSWWHSNAFADDLHSSLTTLKNRLNFSSHDILWSGVSGGSTFLTMQFIPKVGKYYSGSVAATCGGAPSNLFSNADLPLLKASYSMHFIYGDEDFLADPNGTYGAVIPKTITQYSQYGFPISKKILPNTTHCAFDVNKEIIKIWDGY